MHRDGGRARDHRQPVAVDQRAGQEGGQTGQGVQPFHGRTPMQMRHGRGNLGRAAYDASSGFATSTEASGRRRSDLADDADRVAGERADRAQDGRGADVVEGQGAHPLQLLSSVASIVRAMLTNFERINRLSGGKLPRNYNDFQARVFPALEAEAKANKSKVPHPYAAFMSVQSAMGYGRQELLRGLVACAEADLALKLGGDVLVLERLLWTLCGKAAAWDSQMHVIRREQER